MQRDDRDDLVLLRAHTQGDPDAFGEIVRRHQARLWAVALRTLGNPDDAADALQDGLLSAFRSASSFRGQAAVTTWLHRIVVNACLDRVRTSKRHPTVSMTADAQGSVDAVEQTDTAVAVQAALRELPAEQRIAIVLVDITGYPVDDAARILEIPTGTVKSRCARGRARLAVLLGHLRDDGNQDPPGDVGFSEDGKGAADVH